MRPAIAIQRAAMAGVFFLAILVQCKAASPEEEERFINKVKLAFQNEDSAAIDALSCHDGIPSEGERRDDLLMYFNHTVTGAELSPPDEAEIHDLDSNLRVTKMMRVWLSGWYEPIRFPVGEKNGHLMFSLSKRKIPSAFGEAEFRSIEAQFLALQKRRSIVLRDSAAEKSRHVVALKMVYSRAKSLQDRCSEFRKQGGVGTGYDERYLTTINTELRIFGADFPEESYWTNNDEERVEPKIIRDPETRISYKLNADGRRITAVAPNGTVLWVRDPFRDGHLQPLRVTRPVITRFQLSPGTKEEAEEGEHIFLGDYSKRRIEIYFNSSQFGVVSLKTGRFVFVGQN